MAKGLEKYRERQDALGRFGKDLTRRSGACCELCQASGKRLSVFEVPPEPSEPDFQKCLFICDECSAQLRKPKTIDPEYWRGLAETIWSEVPAVQVQAARILERLSPTEPWARDLLDQAMIEESLLPWIRAQVL